MSLVHAPSESRQKALTFVDPRLYLACAALVLGNVLLPLALHRLPGAGAAFMPILFFTLVAGWRFGPRAAVLTAVLSPLANHALTGMPPAPALQGLILQSALLGILAALAAARRPPKGELAMTAMPFCAANGRTSWSAPRLARE